MRSLKITDIALQTCNPVSAPHVDNLLTIIDNEFDDFTVRDMAAKRRLSR